VTKSQQEPLLCFERRRHDLQSVRKFQKTKRKDQKHLRKGLQSVRMYQEEMTKYLLEVTKSLPDQPNSLQLQACCCEPVVWVGTQERGFIGSAWQVPYEPVMPHPGSAPRYPPAQGDTV
jgi:hypothetical protein